MGRGHGDLVVHDGGHHAADAGVRAEVSGPKSQLGIQVVRGQTGGGVQEYKSTRVQAYNSTRVHKYKSTRVQEDKSTREQEYKSTRVQKCII